MPSKETTENIDEEINEEDNADTDENDFEEEQ